MQQNTKLTKKAYKKIGKFLKVNIIIVCIDNTEQQGDCSFTLWNIERMDLRV